MFSLRMKFGFTVGALLSISLLIYACGGGGGGGTSPGATTTTINSPTGGTQAASAGTTGAQAGTGLSDVAASLGQAGGGGAFGFPKPMNPLTQKSAKYSKIISMNNKVAHSKAMQKVSSHFKAAKSKSAFAPQAIPSSTDPCFDGGTVTSDGTWDDATGAFTLNLTFNDCREDGSIINGPSSVSGAESFDLTTNLGGITMTLTLGATGNPFTVKDFEEIGGNLYANLAGIFTSTATLTEGFNISAIDGSGNETGVFTLEANGTATFDDFITPPTTITFTGFKVTENFNDAAGTWDDTLNGAITETETISGVDHTVSVAYTNLIVSVTEAAATEDVSISGTVAVNFTPDSDCGIEGTFSFATPTALRYVDGASCPVSGKLVINGNTDLVFSQTGVDVSVDGGAPTHYDDCDALLSTCEVEDFDNTTSTSSGAGAAVTGTGMLVTLSWSNDANIQDVYV
ncbi:MAG TPA: hypothetical protein VIK48_05260, partial [Candidatus Manganitrophaceae bacterium]